MGFDVIKKLMVEDGQLVVNDREHYIRTRSPKSPPPHFMVYWRYGDEEDAGEVFNRRGEIKLNVDYDIFSDSNRIREVE